MTSIRRNRTRKLTRTAARTRLALVPTPALVRLPRVRAAQKRIESGWYDRDEVRDKLAAAVLDALLTD